MSATQAARDYAADEGLTSIANPDGSVEVLHTLGSARVYPDGDVVSVSNPRLQAVLERKIMQSRAKEARLQEDPSARCTIKFSARYSKMPDTSRDDTTLLAVLKTRSGQLSPEFLAWDTKYADQPGNYPLTASPEYLVLMLLTDGRLWTTIRAAWPPEKEEYYRSHIGEPVNIQIEGMA